MLVLRGIRGQLAPVDGKHLPSDQPQFVADQKNLPKQMGNLILRGRNEMSDGREMGSAVCAQVQLVVDQVVDCVLEGAWKDLILKVDRDELALFVGVVFVTGHSYLMVG